MEVTISSMLAVRASLPFLFGSMHSYSFPGAISVLHEISVSHLVPWAVLFTCSPLPLHILDFKLLENRDNISYYHLYNTYNS